MQRNILVVAADDAEVALLTRTLSPPGQPYVVTTASSLDQARGRLGEARIDAIVASAVLPDGCAVELGATQPAPAMVFLTRSPAEELAARASSPGDVDFLPYAPDHGHLALLPQRVAAALGRAEQQRELRRLRSLSTKGSLLQALADHVPVLLGYWTRDQICGFASRAYEAWFGLRQEDILGMSLAELLGPLYPQNLPHIEAALRGERRDFERVVADPAGGPPRHALISYIPFVHGGLVDGFFVVVSDVSELKHLETRLRESEQRWQTLFSILPVGVCITDANGQITTANPEMERIAGLSVAAMMRGEFRKLQIIQTDGTTMPKERLATAQARQTGGQASADLGLVRGDGTTVWISSIAAPIPDRPGSTLIATSDVTLRRQAEQALRENEARLRALLDAAVDGIVTVDDQSRIRTANRALCKMFGYSLDELLGAEVGILMSEADRLRHREYIARYEATGEAKVIGTGRELVGRHRDGSELPLFLALDRLPPEAKVGKYIATLHDLRARKVVENEKRALEDHLRESEKLHAVGRLAGGVAHDFNNILTVVELCGSTILQQVEPGSRLQHEAEQILSASRRGAELVRQLLTFSRPELLSRSTVDLSAVVRRLEPMLRRLLPANIQLQIEATEATPVEADLAHMDQVLMNLVLNARDAMAAGGLLTVSVRSLTITAAEARPPLRAGSCVELVVRDSGIGMSKAVSERAFEPFFTTKEPGLGTGLGLATVYGIVQQAGGSIDLTTAPRQGTRVRIWLPRASASLGVTRAPLLAPTIRVQNSTILLVEDQPEILELVTQVLRSKGYRVLAATTGEQAVELAHSSPESIDLLFTDVMMPGLSGPQVYSRVAVWHPRTKVLFASGYSDELIELEGTQPVAFEFLPKPYSVSSLLATVARILGGEGA